MDTLKGLILATGAMLILFGAFSSVVFEPQYQAAGTVLICGGLLFVGLGILAHLMGSR